MAKRRNTALFTTLPGWLMVPQPSLLITRLSHGWRRWPGRPRSRWLDQVRADSGTPSADLRRRAVRRGHGTGVTQRLSPATRLWWWLILYFGICLKCIN